MSVTVNDKNLGHATAYAYAKSKGYTGTEEEFAELMASYAEVATDARGYAEQAEQSASNAQQSATNASSYASSASASANSASASAQTAVTKASEASDSATSASESASTAVSAKDDAMTAKESAETAKADAETAAEEAQESAQTVANKADKDGTYPYMTVGGVMSSDGSTDSTPYLYRVSGGGVEVGSVEEDSIVGGTVAWNQLFNKDNFRSTTTANGITFTNNGDGSVKVSGTATALATFIFQTNAFDLRKDHVYLLNTTGLEPNVFMGFDGDGFSLTTAQKRVIKETADGTAKYSYIRVADGTTVNTVIYPQIIDLTQMFGTSVADYIYSLEQSSTGAGVAFFRKLFPKDYYEYNTGELMSVEGVSAHVMRDVDDNIIGNYPLDSSLTLRGIPKLDAQNNLYYDGDVYEADGTVERKYGVITYDGSTDEPWRIQSTGSTIFYIENSDLKKSPNYSGEIICDKLKTTQSYGYMTDDYIIAGYVDRNNQYPNQNWIYVRVNSSITEVSAFNAWLQANPITVVYELATPTTESAEPYDSIQKVSKYGTEEYVSSGIVPVGHVTKYPTDIVAKVNGLPSDFSTLIAPTESGFKATRAYSVNQFIIVDNQLYRVTSAIASGATITVGTNVTATTVADILTALLNA